MWPRSPCNKELYRVIDAIHDLSGETPAAPPRQPAQP
jgi:hypothetical protein